MQRIGIVIRDKAVDKKTICTASLASLSYFSAKIAVVVPAGIPDKTVQTATAKAGSLNKKQRPNTTAGIMIKRKKL